MIFRKCSRLEQRVQTLQWMECQGVWCRIFEAMSDDPVVEYLIVDFTIVRAHQHAGAKKGVLKITLGRSRGGLSTKIHMAVRGLG